MLTQSQKQAIMSMDLTQVFTEIVEVENRMERINDELYDVFIPPFRRNRFYADLSRLAYRLRFLRQRQHELYHRYNQQRQSKPA